MERHVVAGRQLVELAVVGDNGPNVERQQTAFPAKQQIVEAMTLFADQDDRAHRLGPGVQMPQHFKRLGKRVELGLQILMRRLRAGKLHPHEKQAGVAVVVLGRFFDVAAAFEQKARNREHQTQAVRTGKGQNISRVHKASIVAGRRVLRPDKNETRRAWRWLGRCPIRNRNRMRAGASYRRRSLRTLFPAVTLRRAWPDAP